MINGQRCTACCQAIMIPQRVQHVIRCADQAPADSDVGFIRDNWTPISRRRAKKKNPYMFTVRRLRGKDWSFWMCRHLTPDGCGVYEARPRICRDYPVYSGPEQFKKYAENNPPEYHPDCTYWSQQIPAVNV